MLTFRQFCIQEKASTSPCHTLGVSSHATPEEISSAYRKLAVLFHSDKHYAKPDRQAYEDIFKIITGARETLNKVTDPEKRRSMYIRPGEDEPRLGCRDDGAPSPWADGDHGQGEPRAPGVEPEADPVPERQPREFRPENAARDYSAKMREIRAYYTSLGKENSPEHIAASKAARAEFYQ